MKKFAAAFALVSLFAVNAIAEEAKKEEAAPAAAGEKKAEKKADKAEKKAEKKADKAEEHKAAEAK